jgi:hypothetical protein
METKIITRTGMLAVFLLLAASLDCSGKSALVDLLPSVEAFVTEGENHTLYLELYSGASNASSENYAATDFIPHSEPAGMASENYAYQSVVMYFSNAPPRVSEIPDQSWSYGTNRVLDLGSYFSDPDNDTLYYTAEGTSSISISIDENGIATMSPQAGWYGSENVRFYASDGFYTVRSDTVRLTVTGPAPTTPSGPSGGWISGCTADLLEIEPNVLDVVLLQEQTTTRELVIRSKCSGRAEVEMETENVSRFITSDKQEFSIEPFGEERITLAFKVSSTETPGVYTGRIVVRCGAAEKAVIVVVEVKPRTALFDVMLRIPESNRSVMAGDPVEAEIALYNFGTLKPVDVAVTYSINDFSGNVLNLGEKTIAVNDYLLMRESLEVPNQTKEGIYMFYVTLSYGNETATSTEVFTVYEHEKFGILDFILTFWQAILGSFIGVSGGIYVMKKRKGEKEKTAARAAEEEEWERITERYRDKLEEALPEGPGRGRGEKYSEKEWEALIKKYAKKTRKNGNSG